MRAAGDFECGTCMRGRASAEVTADCGATLIVCPTPILQQWRDEVARHLHPGALPAADSFYLDAQNRAVAPS